MKMTEFFLAELEREARGTRKALERVPEGHDNWKPHEKSMPLGYLAGLVATMPGWISFMVEREELDIASVEGANFKPKAASTSRELLQTFDESLAKGRDALQKTNDEHLLKPWRFVVSGHVASEEPRYVMIQDAVFNHLAHHRGQLTVYLRLNGAAVPALYGPSADEPI